MTIHYIEMRRGYYLATIDRLENYTIVFQTENLISIFSNLIFHFGVGQAYKSCMQ